MSGWKTKVFSIVLGLSVLVPTASFAADTVADPADLPSNAKFIYHQQLDGEQGLLAEDNILDLVGKYAPDSMEDWQSVIAEREQLISELKEQVPERRPELSDEVKEKLQAVREQVENGTMTQEQAAEELKELGLEKMGTIKQRPELSDEVKEKLQAVREQVENGTMTQEQAAEELKELGLEKMGTIKQRPELSDEVKEKLQAIREQVENGTMTPEQASEEFEELGLRGKLNLTNLDNIMAQLDEAVESGDESTIKDVLAQLLEQMKDRNQQLAARLSEKN
ncbi:hypothetical protein [Desulfoscipio gibsoniae]